jgi:hypothetical protein
MRKRGKRARARCGKRGKRSRARCEKEGNEPGPNVKKYKYIYTATKTILREGFLAMRAQTKVHHCNRYYRMRKSITFHWAPIRFLSHLAWSGIFATGNLDSSVNN